ncbi:pre-60S ribosomal particles component [Haplosporangium sp. Z 11]|nr:pre-60S ribosomal particles component [Haplosporangium sp. Z 11]
MSNAQVLSSGSEVYAKKRKARQEQIKELTFDPEARKEYLTGFHKRKVHRQNVARELAKQREHEEKLEARKEIRYGEALSDEEEDETVFSGDDDNDDEKTTKGPKQSKFKTKTSLTTVTVIEDMDQDDGTFGLPKNNAAVMAKNKNKKARKGEDGDQEDADEDQGQGEDEDEDEDENGGDKKRRRIGSSSATSAKGAKKIWPAKEKKKKFRYEGKVQRKVTAIQDKMRGNRGPGGREERGKKGGRGGRGGGRGRR